MLQELTIDNLAIIKHLSLDFSDHMTVLTGETGAGKSIIIDAVGLLAGGRGSQEYIRRGADKLSLQGQFALPQDLEFNELLDSLGIDHEDGILIISREIYRRGRNVIRVNGQLINTATLRQIGSRLVDIQGQNEHQLLLQPENHLGMLDQFAHNDIQELLNHYRVEYQDYMKLRAAVSKKQNNEQQWAQRLDMLRYQVKEISEANLKVEEEEQLMSERDRLEHFQQINNSLRQAVTVFNGGDQGAVLDQIATVMNSINEITEFDAAYDSLSKSLNDAYYALQDVATEASRQLDILEFDDNRLGEIDQRLTIIGDLEHKYGDSVKDVLDYYAKIKHELDSMEEAADSNSDLEERLATAEERLTKTGQQLSQIRQQAAHQLTKLVHQQLKEVYMDKAVFEVHFAKQSRPHFTPTGIDEVEFYIQTNPGEMMGPLARIVSGGELSRVMLALKTIFAQNEGVTSIIFDEVDTGVSGRVAQSIADKIKVIADKSQVLCITHLPQVAAVAQHHFLIQKHVKDERTTTMVTILDESQRVNELARMLSGEKVTKLTKEHAQELLKMAQR
ncbi:DNA repair protein RecN [Limosilactobacillus fastidiosus]|uniref:DNA repair protein RecN n=1 Tax=Limosilactobacillus fastidiosus TaxID=2759855 RepID=A0A7W3U0L3_9LACO|nr:DNA repair protein RecN [Limosilactobacillus fastidiosus]MBB1063744.1 DNA repair protein RecN [Limosilactobacillus fastidiosus]MBB1086727.1 DNA repair protein RecN [Limosilactobacillus fastidiosus]MCD7084319.1 DNA repair protein RecN [Limosilactobacillus fastidiosus]MCD7085546.1 DNA repair protein RecN [Limosilactobacillus fastidiosus]MCD7114777.1 DNA repair protein RecN [Limosilactobacillus fastidiosus]